MFYIPENSKNFDLETSAERTSNTFMSIQQNEGRIKVLKRLISPLKMQQV
jgi:hypothetical protein